MSRPEFEPANFFLRQLDNELNPTNLCYKSNTIVTNLSSFIITSYQENISEIYENNQHVSLMGAIGEISNFYNLSPRFLLSTTISSEGSTAIVKKFDFDFLMIFGSTSLPQPKNMF